MKRATLVTGAAGFAGSHLLDRLRGRARIVAWYRPGGRPPADKTQVTWRAVDVLDRAAVVAEIARSSPSRIYHLAGAPQVHLSWQNATPHLQTNVLGTSHILDAVRLAGRPCRIVVVSSAQMYKPQEHAALNEDAPIGPSSPYGVSKLAQDELARLAAVNDGLDVVVARPFNHAGPRQDAAFAVASFARQIAIAERSHAASPIRVGNLDAERDITDVRDVVAAYERMAEDGVKGRAYNIASGRAVRIGDLLERLIRRSTTRITISVDEARLRPADATSLIGDASRARDELGWTPQIPLDQTLADTLDWWRATVTDAEIESTAGAH